VVGRYRAGERLPSVRDLAQAFGINPSTVQVVLGRLQTSGFVSGHPRLGFVVRDIEQLGGIATWRYVFRFAPIRALIVLVAAISAIGFSYAVLTPVYARDVFHGDARTLGGLMAGSGTGALLSALYLGTRKSVRGLGYVITLGGTFMGLALISFAFSHWLPLSFLCLMLAGSGGD